jgi:hypothetical protein
VTSVIKRQLISEPFSPVASHGDKHRYNQSSVIAIIVQTEKCNQAD